MDNSIYETIQKILGVYTLILTIVGTLTSFVSFFICIKLRKTSTFVLLAFMSISDSVTLYFWNITHYINTWYNLDFLDLNYWLCKFGNYYQFTSLQISAWLLVKNKCKK